MKLHLRLEPDASLGEGTVMSLEDLRLLALKARQQGAPRDAVISSVTFDRLMRFTFPTVEWTKEVN